MARAWHHGGAGARSIASAAAASWAIESGVVSWLKRRSRASPVAAENQKKRSERSGAA